MNDEPNVVLFMFVALVLLGGLTLWGRAWQRLAAGEPLLAPEPRPRVRWGLVDLFVALLAQVVVAGIFAQWSLTRFGIDPDQMSIPQRAQWTLGAAVATLAHFLLVCGWLMVRHHPSAAELGWDGRRWISDARIGVAAFLMLAPVVYGLQLVLVQFIEYKHPLLEMLKQDPSPHFFIISGMVAVLVAPVSEEFLYRMLLQGWLERAAQDVDHSAAILQGGPSGSAKNSEPAIMPPDSGAGIAGPLIDADGAGKSELCRSNSPPEVLTDYRRTWPIVVSALIFGLVHLGNGPDPIPLFVLGLGLGYLFQQTGRLLPCIIVHALLNGCTLLMLWIQFAK